MQSLVQIKGLSVEHHGKKSLEQITFSINRGEHWALTGPSASGKTVLTMVITGEIQFSGSLTIAPGLKIQRMAQQHHFRNRSNMEAFYYQQRYQSMDADDSYTMQELLKDELVRDAALVELLSRRLHVEALLDRPLIQLSNGENKRMQMLRALLREPDLLILDNPFIGLDGEGRAILHELLEMLSREAIALLVVCPPQEIPECITHVAQLENGRIIGVGNRNHLTSQTFTSHRPPSTDWAFPEPIPFPPFRNAVALHDVQVTYQGKTVLDHINWTVERGSCWLLSGPNGAGKSTLLSLINADNPQAYANDISLFDKKRGAGESIWEIKRLTGYVSPELHLFFDHDVTVQEVIGSGLFDTIGLFRKLSLSQEAVIGEWMRILGLSAFRNQLLKQLPLGLQRMVMLARALIKNPPLLLLDEPCQGLDGQQTVHFNELVSALCRHFGTTLIYVSHYTEMIPSCIDRHIRLEQGKRVV